jgi:hypothetical protein
MQTPPTFRGEVPTAEDVLGFALGSQEVTAAQSDAYVDAVDAASARVVGGTLGTTWQGRPIRYALVGRPENVTPEGLAGIQQAARTLRDPATSDQQAADIARRSPAILWLMGNVHGGGRADRRRAPVRTSWLIATIAPPSRSWTTRWWVSSRFRTRTAARPTPAKLLRVRHEPRLSARTQTETDTS